MFMALDKMPAAGDYGTLLAQFLPLVVLIVVFYFVLIRPQRKRDKQERDMRNSIEIGDEISTIGGRALLHPLPMCRGERAPHRAASAAEYRAIRQAPMVKGYRPATDPHWFFSSFHSLPPNFIYMSCYSARNGVITLRPSLLPWAPRPSRSPEPPYRGSPSGKS